MTKPPIPTENSKTKGQHTQTPPKTSIAQRLRTDLGRSVGVTSNPTGVVKPVYGIPTFPITKRRIGPVLAFNVQIPDQVECWPCLHVESKHRTCVSLYYLYNIYIYSIM